ncbi:methyl-accepting chemotaxis protein [Candidatus Vecturithrix granuli]|uniref:Methyl-accepting chemotaxis protein n=1 Tax=Vecturithrix granuli TaxID=1499967 RepID=A0A081C9C2_VECG1|nr:methyl-accepting chemotaxis protein [Candidatus Vecturithrix granuli]
MHRPGLRGKLVIAFVLFSVVPLVFVSYFASRQGMQVEQKTRQLQQQNKDMVLYLIEYAKEHSNEIEQQELKEFIAKFQEINTTTFNEYAGYIQGRQRFFPILIVAVITVSAGFAFVLGKILADPILHFTQIVQQISQGDLQQQINVKAHDELGRLNHAFQAMTTYMQEMAQTANQIADGNIQQIAHPKSSRDTLGLAFYAMGQYLQHIAALAHKIAEGDLRQSIPLKSSGDLLGSAFHKMATSLALLIQQIKQEVQAIGKTSQATAQRAEQDMKMIEEVLSSTEETSSSMMQMQASVEEVSGNMSVLSRSIENTVSSIEQMNMSIKQIAVNTKGLSEAAQETFGVVQAIGETINRLVKTANQAEYSSQETLDSANAGQAAVRDIIEGMKVIQRVVTTSAETINVLGSRSREIGSVVDVISDIADQTSLLSLNASIIAAQAGEHGRGFAVVAQEVKELANRSLNSAHEIEQLIKGVQTELQKAVQSIEEGRQAVENGVIRANRGGDALEAILSSVRKTLEFIADNARIAEEQSALSEQVRQYMETVLTMVNEIARATSEQQKGSTQVTEAVEQMRNLSEQVKRATIEQTRGTGHVLAAIDNVTLQVQESSTRAHESVAFSNELVQKTAAVVGLLNQFQVDDHVAPNVSDENGKVFSPAVVSIASLMQ